MRPYILKETNWLTVKDEQFELAILPWGATEAHNFHMPYGTDIYESDYISAESARIAWESGSKVIVLPTIPFGVNTGQSDILLDINMNPSTQMAILSDVLTVLDRQGIKKLMILNSHGGNNFKPLVRELGLKFPDMFICFANWFQSLDKSEYFDNAGDHADEMETSLMLHLEPELILPKDKWGDGKAKKHRIQEFNEGWLWSERQWSQISEDTGVGNPHEATLEKGKRYFKAITDKMASAIIQICEMDRNDMYV